MKSKILLAIGMIAIFLIMFIAFYVIPAVYPDSIFSKLANFFMGRGFLN